eukprot:Opistho-2@86688
MRAFQRNGLAALAVFALTASLVSARLSTHGKYASSHVEAAERAMRAVREVDERVDFVSHNGLGTASFVTIPDDVSEKLRARRSDSIEDSVSHFLSTYGAAFGVSEANADQLTRTMLETDDHDVTHVSFAQMYKGIPVFGAGIKAHFGRGLQLTSAQGVFVAGVGMATVVPAVQQSAAAHSAIVAVAEQEGLNLDKDDFVAKNVRLFVYNPALLASSLSDEAPVDRTAILAYSVTVTSRKGPHRVFVDAMSGQAVKVLSERRTKLSQEHYEERDNNNVTRVFKTGDDVTKVKLSKSREIIKSMKQTYNMMASITGGRRLSFDGKDSTLKSVLYVYASTPCGSSKDCKGTFGNCFKGRCIPDDCPNAFWNGQQMVFCQEYFTDDTVGHELGHAFMEYTGGTVYEYESGAIDESFAGGCFMHSVSGAVVCDGHGTVFVGDIFKLGD